MIEQTCFASEPPFLVGVVPPGVTEQLSNKHLAQKPNICLTRGASTPWSKGEGLCVCVWGGLCMEEDGEGEGGSWGGGVVV